MLEGENARAGRNRGDRAPDRRHVTFHRAPVPGHPGGLGHHQGQRERNTKRLPQRPERMGRQTHGAEEDEKRQSRKPLCDPAASGGVIGREERERDHSHAGQRQAGVNPQRAPP